MVDDQTFLGDRFFLIYIIFIFIKLKHVADETSGFPRNIGFCQDHHIHTMVHVNIITFLVDKETGLNKSILYPY